MASAAITTRSPRRTSPRSRLARSTYYRMMNEVQPDPNRHALAYAGDLAAMMEETRRLSPDQIRLLVEIGAVLKALFGAGARLP